VRLTQAIRSKLKAAKKLGADECELVQLKNLQWTEAQRGDARNYQSGQVVQFHQNIARFGRGERVGVIGRDERGVSVVRQDGRIANLPLDMAARFQVCESREIGLAAGDWVRVTRNGFTKDGHRLNNGDLKQVKGFTKDADIKLTNGWVIGKDFGNLTHGFCLTSHSSQSKGVDCVFVAESSESFRAADREQFYVSVSRFKESLTIYTDDKHQLLECVRKSSRRPSAMDLVSKEIPKVSDVGVAESWQRPNWSPRPRIHKLLSRGIGI
jgi:ATP-dependent exoDNAse (exonuclease V) alpha subunit